jgi:hypothetical protein
MATTPRKAPAAPVANLAQSRKELAASKAAHPAGKKAPAAKRAPATKAAKPEQAKTVYTATGRGGVERRATSTGTLVAAVEAVIQNRRGAHFAKGAVIAFYASKEKAQAAADTINGGNVDGWSDARVIACKQVSA